MLDVSENLHTSRQSGLFGLAYMNGWGPASRQHWCDSHPAAASQSLHHDLLLCLALTIARLYHLYPCELTVRGKIQTTLPYQFQRMSTMSTQIQYIVELPTDLPFTQKPRVFSVLQQHIISHTHTHIVYLYMYIYIYISYRHIDMSAYICTYILYAHTIAHTYIYIYIYCISSVMCIWFLTRLLFCSHVCPSLPAGVRALTGLGAAFGSTARPLAPAKSGSYLKRPEKRWKQIEANVYVYLNIIHTLMDLYVDISWYIYIDQYMSKQYILRAVHARIIHLKSTGYVHTCKWSTYQNIFEWLDRHTHGHTTHTDTHIHTHKKNGMSCYLMLCNVMSCDVM